MCIDHAEKGARMKIPDKVRICGIDYTVELVSSLDNGSDVLYGKIDHKNSVIYLNKGNHAHQYQCITLLHEILHGIENYARLELGKNTEYILDVLAFGLYQVLQDNGRALFDLKESEE